MNRTIEVDLPQSPGRSFQNILGTVSMVLAVAYCVSVVLYSPIFSTAGYESPADAEALLSHYAKYSLAYAAIGISAFLYPRDIRLATLMVALIGCFMFLPAIEVARYWSRWPLLALLGAIIGFEFTSEAKPSDSRGIVIALVPAIVLPIFLIGLDVLCAHYLSFMFG